MFDVINPRCFLGSGINLVDISGNSHGGSFESTTTVSNGYISFAGTSDLRIAGAYTGPSIFSVGVWFNTSTASGCKLIGYESNQSGTASTTYDRHFAVDTTGRLYWGMNTTLQNVFSYGVVNNGTWHYACVTCNNGTLSHYLDGVLVGTSISIAQSYVGYWRVGGYRLATWPNSIDGYFIGSVSIIQICNTTVLTAEQIAQNFNAYRGRYGV